MYDQELQNLHIIGRKIKILRPAFQSIVRREDQQLLTGREASWGCRYVAARCVLRSRCAPAGRFTKLLVTATHCTPMHYVIVKL